MVDTRTNAQRIKDFQQQAKKRRKAKKQRESGVVIEPVELEPAKTLPLGKFNKNTTLPGADPQKGVFVNRTTGQQVDRFGKPLNQPKAVEQKPERTVRQRAESLFQKQEFDDPLGFAEDLGLDVSSLPTTLDEHVKQLKESQTKELESAKSQATLSANIQTQALGQARDEAAGAIAGTKADLAASREGPSSLGNIQVASDFEQLTDRRIRLLEDQAMAAQMSRESAIQRLEKAQQEGNLSMAKAAQVALDNAENQIRKIDTDLLNASTAASQEARAVQQAARQNLETFFGIIEIGTTLTPEGIKGLASQLDIPFEDAFDFYQGSQYIRQDKQSSTQEKAIRLEDLKVDLARKKAGRDDLKLRQVDQLSQMYKSGASAEEISSYKELVGITDREDPLYKTELAIKAAEAKIKQAEANGELLDPRDITDLAIQKAKLAELRGDGTEAFIPNKSLEGFEVSFQDGMLKIQGGKDKAYQCGEFVNRVWGLSSGGSGGFADSYESKKQQIDVDVDTLNDANFGQLVKPGMAFVMGASGSASPYGHVGIVTSIDPTTGTFTTAETNIQGDKINKSPAVQKVRSYKDVDGFTIPPNSTLEKPDGSLGGLKGKFLSVARQQGLSGKKAEEFAEEQVKAAYKPLTEGQSKSFEAYIKVKPENEAYDQLVKDLNLEDDTKLEKFADSINFITNKIKKSGLTAELINASIDDPKIRQAILSEMRWIEGKLRKESGAVISQEEYESNGTQFFPRANDDAETIRIKAQRRKNIEKGLEGQMGPAGTRIFEEQFGLKEGPVEQEIDDISIYQEILNAPLQEDIDFYNNL